jgi:GPI-anchor transamidase subunit S
VESQIQFYAPLAFEPRSLSNGQDVIYGLSQENLKVFVNSAEWTLGMYLRRLHGRISQVDDVFIASSVSNDPVLHFVVFVPSVSHSPLRILDDAGESCYISSGHHLIRLGQPISSDTFILPQWGGIVLLNLPEDGPSKLHLTEAELDHVFSGFRAQLLRLIGVSELPPEVRSAEPSLPLTDFQLDTLYRQRTFENAGSSKETLQSIVKLVDQIANMPVGQDVRDDVLEALSALEVVRRVLPLRTYSNLKRFSYMSGFGTFLRWLCNTQDGR